VWGEGRGSTRFVPNHIDFIFVFWGWVLSIDIKRQI
jgi:hypothetical protein